MQKDIKEDHPSFAKASTYAKALVDKSAGKGKKRKSRFDKIIEKAKKEGKSKA